MKNVLKINLMTALMLTFCIMATAQDRQQRISREQLAEKQAKHIANELTFDEAVTQQFVKTYCAYQQELWALGPNHKEEPAKERFERSQQILDLREKYYKEYSKFLTQSQIQKVYKLERQTMNRLNKHRGHKHRNHESH